MAKYGLIVVGAGLGGLAAASLAAKGGKNVIVLEPGEAAGGLVRPIKKEAFLFYPGPQVSFGFERGGELRQILEKLGITPQATLRTPCYQVALPDHRITVFAEQSETIEELKREFPQEIVQIKSFYQDLGKQAAKNEKSRISAFLSGAKSAGPFIQSYRFSREFTAFLDIQSFYFFRLPASAISLSSLIMLCDSAPYSIAFGKLATQLVEVLVKNGAEIRYRVPVSEISLKGGTLSSSLGDMTFDSVLVNTEQQPRSNLLLTALKNEAVPVSMDRHVIAIADYGYPERFFTLSLDSGNEQSVAPLGTRALTAEFAAMDGLSDAAHRDQIRQLIPFFDDFVSFSHELPSRSAVFNFPDRAKLHPVNTGDRHPILARSSIKGVFVLPDGAGTPLQSVAGARRFVELTI